MVPIEQTLGNSAEDIIRLQCVSGYILSLRVTLESKYAALQSTLLKYLFPEKCYETILHLLLMSTHSPAYHLGPGPQGPVMIPVGQRLFW